MTKSAMSLVLATCFLLPACGDDEDPVVTTGTLEIRGDWASDFGTEVIGDESWTVTFEDDSATSEVVEFSNEENAAVLLGSDGKYQRNVWTDVEGDSFYYCTVSYGQESAQDAIDQSEPYDDTDPASSGCGTGDFFWTKLTRQ
jgi:hypothetical protein